MRLGLLLTGGGLAAAVAAGPGTRLGVWSFRVGLLLQALSVLVSAGGGGILAWSLVSARKSLPRRRRLEAAVGVLAALGLVGIPAGWVYTALRVPAIHDITTDTHDPPAFRALLDRRRGAPNPSTYPGDSAARRQAEAYPEIRTLSVGAPLPRVLSAARTAADELGWEVVAVDTGAGRLEAVDTSFWFGFRDDVVVRLTPADGTLRVDVRSVSRVGTSDLGTNARRIRRFLNLLRESTPAANG